MSNLDNLVKNVTYDVYVTDRDFQAMSQFPPHRFVARDERIALLEAMWYGDFRQLLDLPEDIQMLGINYFQSYAKKVANILTMEGVEGVDSHIVYQAIIDMIRHGGCIFYTLDGELEVADPGRWYPVSEDEAYFVAPFISNQAEEAIPDYVSIWHIPDGGVASEFIHKWEEGVSHGQIGEPVSSRNLGRSQLLLVPNQPNNGIWGTSGFIEMAPPTAEITNRMSRQAVVMDANGRPIPVFTGSDKDVTDVFNRGGDPNAANTEAVKSKIEQGLIDINKRQALRLPDGIKDFDFKSPNVQGVTVALEVIERNQKILSQLKALKIFEGDDIQIPSGEALKREMLDFFAETKSMQNDIIEALEVLGFTVEWQHIFDIFEAQDIELAAQNARSNPLVSTPTGGTE